MRGRAFSRAEAIRSEISAARLRGPGVRRLARGLYFTAAVDPALTDHLEAYLLVLPRGRTAVDGVTALHVWGIRIASATPYRFVTTAAYASKRPGVRVRRAAELPPRQGRCLRPVPALVAARTELSLLEQVSAGDWIVHAGLATLDEVGTALSAATGAHCRTARRAGELVRARVESPQETKLRLMMVFAGLPEPECNVELFEAGSFLGRVDLYLRSWRIVLEYEGDHHRTDLGTFAYDLTRHERLTASGALCIRVAKQHLRLPRSVVQRIWAALVSRGYEGPPPRFGREWREAFERGERR